MSDSNIKVKVKNLQNNVKYMQDDVTNHCLKACLPHTSQGRGEEGREHCTDFAFACGMWVWFSKRQKYQI